MLVVIGFGVITLLLAVKHFVRPSERRISMVKMMSIATVFSICAAVSANAAVVMTRVPNHPEWSVSPKVNLVVMTGLGEALTPAIIGFTLLSIAWIFVTSGFRKL